MATALAGRASVGAAVTVAVTVAAAAVGIDKMRDEDLWRQIEAAPLLPAANLRLPGSIRLFSNPMPAQIREAIVAEFKRFVYLLAVSRTPLMPSPWVAVALRLVVAGGTVAGYGNIKLADIALRTPLFRCPVYRQTRALRAAEFGGDDSEHIRPGPLALALQLLGCGSLTVGIGLAVLAKLGVATPWAALALLILGGFLWGTEGPWPSNLPIRKGFMAQSAP